jgi:hypothetical protein
MLTKGKSQTGSAAMESVFSIVVLVFLVLGVVEVAFSLYARNVVAASAHEGARAAVERGRNPDEAEAIAAETVRGSAGGLVDDIEVYVGTQMAESGETVVVVVRGRVKPFGPIAFPMSLTAKATSTREVEIP